MRHLKWRFMEIALWKIQTTMLIMLIYFIPFSVLGQSDLERKYLTTPDEAKPRGYWIWNHGNFDYNTIDPDLCCYMVC